MSDSDNGSTHSGCHGDEPSNELDFADLMGVMDGVETSDDEAADLQLQRQLQLPLSLNGDDQDTATVAADGDASFVVALFCDGFVCRHWTTKSGWVEGFAQSYDATSRYFLDCLEKERLPDGLLELMEYTSSAGELLAEIWDLRTHPSVLCPLTSADLPRTAPAPQEDGRVDVRHIVLRSSQLVHMELPEQRDNNRSPYDSVTHSDDDENAVTLTNEEFASLDLGSESDILDEACGFDILDVEAAVALTRSAEDGDVFDEDELLSPSDIEVDDELDEAMLDSADSAAFCEFTGHGCGSDVHIAASDDGDHLDDLHTQELITPKRFTAEEMPPWDATPASSSPREFLSPNEYKAMRPQAKRAHGRDSCCAPSVPSSRTELPTEDSECIVKSGMLRSIAPPFFKQECVKREPEVAADYLPPTPQKLASQNESPSAEKEQPLLKLPREKSDWPDAAIKSTPRKTKKRNKNLKPSIDSVTPLPATHLFLSRLKGKRPRNYTIDELDQGSPAWMMMKHMNRFYQAALLFERRHAQFLQVNVERIMQADSDANEPGKLVAGSMNYLATHLHPITRPDEVVVAASTMHLPAAAFSVADIMVSSRCASLSIDMGNCKLSGKRSPIHASPRGPRSPTAAHVLPVLSVADPGAASRRHKKRSALPPLAPIPPHELHTTMLPSQRSPTMSPTMLPNSPGLGLSFMDALDSESLEF